MSDKHEPFVYQAEAESYPIEPRYHPIHRVTRGIYDFLASARLAMFLLVAILASCLAGVTVIRGEDAWNYIFSTLWFNALLVLLVVNVACCFFGRIWGRRVTLISFGMILFHLSFVTMFLGIVYNSLFYFRGNIRLTEGESLPSGSLDSYDYSNRGRFFDIRKLKGETTLIRLHRGYMVGGKDKRAAYQIAVGEGVTRTEGIIYLTNGLEHRGFKYFPDREGYSALTVLYDRSGRELYGAHFPLQSLRQKNATYLYTTGSKQGPGVTLFPQAPEKPLYFLNITYLPDPKRERSGEALFDLWPYATGEPGPNDRPAASVKARIGEGVDAGNYRLSVREIRYWVVMTVRYEPGQPIVLTSLCVGLAGIILTTFARMFRKQKPGVAHG